MSASKAQQDYAEMCGTIHTPAIAEALERARVVGVLDAWAGSWNMGEGKCVLVRVQEPGQWMRRDYVLADADGHDIEHGADFSRAVVLAQNKQMNILLYEPGEGLSCAIVYPTALYFEGPTPDAARAAAAKAIEAGEL